MATSRPERRTPRSSGSRDVFAPSPRESPAARLPQGACHFKDVSATEARARCGCRRFWTDGRAQDSAEANSGHSPPSPLRPWCMCGHHACFHDPDPGRTSTTAASSTQPTPEQPSRAAWVAATIPPWLVHLAECPSCQSRCARTLQAGRVETDAGPNPGDAWRAAHEHQLVPVVTDAPRTPSDGSRVHAPVLPPIPSQCLMDSDDGALSIRPQFIGDWHEDDHRGATGSEARGLGVAALPDRGSMRSPPAPRPTSTRPRAMHSYSTGSPRNPAGTAPADGWPETRNSTPMRTHPGGRVATIRSADGSASGRPGTAPVGCSPLRDGSHDYLLCPTQLATPMPGGTPEMGTGSKFEASMTQLTTIIRDLHHRDENDGSRLGSHARGTEPSPPNEGSKEDPTDPVAVAKALQQLVPCLDTLKAQMAAYPDMVTALQRHAKRLELLENTSVSHSPHEDLSDRVELVDGRLTDVEGKVDELERWKVAVDEDGHSASQWPDVQRTKRIAEEAHPTASFTSNASARTRISAMSSASAQMAAAAMDRAELASRLTSVEARLSTVELSAPPSVERPWSVEVVILPWGRDLRGIWALPDAPTHAESAASEWTQTRELSRTSSFNQRDDPGGAVWTGPSIRRWAEDTDHWKAARACSTRSRVYKRLRSRGLVREVDVTGGSASDVMAAILEACGEVLGVLNAPDEEDHHHHPTSQGSSNAVDVGAALGLQGPFIPLRKVHRDSRLRFLSPAEMVSSALWTVEFLASSVVMKAGGGQQRLFVTHPDGYLQQQDHDRPGWTWQRLRELPKVVDRQTTTSTDGPTLDVLEGDAREACWEWDSRLDPPTSSRSSFAVDACSSSAFRQDQQAGAHAPAVQRPETLVVRSRSSSPASQHRALPASPMSNLPADLKRQRGSAETAPAVTKVQADALVSQSKRVESLTIKPAPKRRRISRSPTAEGGINCAPTPRRSAPPSPFFEGISGDGRSQATTSRLSNPVKRGETPFAYATPHSGPAMTAMDGRGEPQLLKRDGESLGHGQSRNSAHPGDEEAWEGVGGDDDRHVNDEDDDDDLDDYDDDNEEEESDDLMDEEEDEEEEEEEEGVSSYKEGS